MSATISSHELSELRCSGQNLQIIDVGSENEFAAGHIPGSRCIPLPQLAVRHADIGDGDLVLLCEVGTRAAMAHKHLHQRNGNTLILAGGMRAWREAGLGVIAPLRTDWSLERQVRLGAGIAILIGTALALVVSEAWSFVPAFVGAGLTFAGATDICMIGKLLARMPWNQLRNGNVQPARCS